MGFRKKLLMKLKRDQNVVLVADARSYKQMSLRMYKALSKDFGKICIITSATPVPTLVEELRKDMDISNCFFIDCVSGIRGEKSDFCIYIPASESLELLPEAIDRAMAKGVNLIVLDNIPGLLLYNNEISVLKFMHSLMVRLREKDAKAVHIILSETKSYILDDLTLFADSVVRV